MEILSTATAFATVIGLLADFKSTQKESSQDQYNKFMEWLSKNNHEQLLNEIQANQRISIGIKAAINESAENFQEFNKTSII